MSLPSKAYIAKTDRHSPTKYYFCDEGNVSLFTYRLEHTLHNIPSPCDL